MNLHTPVLLEKIVELLVIKSTGIYVDATLGTGGHSRKILQVLGKNGILIGLDLDSEAVELCKASFQEYKNFFPVHSSYADLRKIIFQHGFRRIDGVVFDLGLSSFELDNSERGFSFSEDGPLDMRFDRSMKKSARIVVNRYPGEKLSEIFYQYGEERKSRTIAKAIVERRQEGEIRTTGELREIICKAVGSENPVKTLARIFQALRIEVNNELGVLSSTLELLPDVLNSGGRAAFITYHSLEDRLVKEYFVRESRDCICPPGTPVCICEHKALFRRVTSKPLKPTAEEIEANRRARSAKLRVYEKL